MKAVVQNLIVLFVLILFQSCSLYYDAKEQSASIPNVVNQNLTVKKYDYSNVFCIGFNHAESQSNYRFSDNWTVQNNFYVSKGFNMIDLGASYRARVYKSLYFDVSPGLSYGDMNYVRTRRYTNGSGGSSYDTYFKKNELINYHYYRGYVNPSFVLLTDEGVKLFVGARLSYTRMKDFDYKFKNEETGYGPDEVITNLSYQENYIDHFGIEPQVSLHIPYRKVGVFFQMMYYGQIGNMINTNTYGIMNRASFPLLMSVGFSVNPGFGK